MEGKEDASKQARKKEGRKDGVDTCVYKYGWRFLDILWRSTYVDDGGSEVAGVDGGGSAERQQALFRYSFSVSWSLRLIVSYMYYVY